MPYNPIEINRKPLTVMGVDYDSLDNFEAALNALGTVMFKGFVPTQKKAL